MNRRPPHVFSKPTSTSKPHGTAPTATPNHLPDWPAIHEQLRRKGVTLQLLWREYHQAHPEGYQRSQFCQLYRDWAKTLEPGLRQVHEPGQKLFVDWAGLKAPIHHANGSVSEASLFVAVMGFSNKTCVEAFTNEQLEQWIAGHCHAFAFYGGLTPPRPPRTLSKSRRGNGLDNLLDAGSQESKIRTM